MPTGFSRTLASWVVSSREDQIPGDVRREATRSLVNWVGCALGGSQHDVMECSIQALSEFSGPRQASLFGRKERFDILNASLLNAISSHVLDFDDTHLDTIIHPAGPVAPVLFALAERDPIDGRDFLHALVLGVEVECRIGMSIYPSHYDKGYHITGTAGVFGAAVAAGKILGLDEQQMNWALGIAATQSAGLREMFGTMCKAFHPGRAAQNGLMAAILASKGFTSSEQSLEAPRGFTRVLSDKSDLSKLTTGLGDTFEIQRNTYKPYPCGVVIHPAIDACIQLRRSQNLDEKLVEVIDKIELKVHPLVLELTGKKTPMTGLEGKFSVYHSCAIALIQGCAGPSEYTDEIVTSPDVVALRNRVSIIVQEDIREDECLLEITFKDGRSARCHVEHVVGSLEKPMSDTELNEKFYSQAEAVIESRQSKDLVAACWEVATLNDVSVIAKLAAR